jgi:hypothetical protein
MKRLLSKIQEDVMTEPDRFEYDVKVYMSMDGDNELEYNQKVRLQYRIEIEYRSWGIKGIYVSFDKPVKLAYNIEGQDEQKEVEIDFGKLADERKLNINWGQGSGYAVEGIDVSLDESGSIRTVDVSAVYAVPVGA